MAEWASQPVWAFWRREI